jgi:hypothetical protein
MTAMNQNPVTPVAHIAKGRVVEGAELEYGPANKRFATPALNFDDMLWSRQEPGPAFDTPLDEILGILEETAKWLQQDPEGLVAAALQNAINNNPMNPDVMRRSYEVMPEMFRRDLLMCQIDNELGGAKAVDGWYPVDNLVSGRSARMRAFPSRILHVIAGNAPGVAATSIARGAVTKSVNLIKLPSNDLFTTTAILRAISAVAPNSPTARSFSAAYWRGGDDKVEGLIMRPQFFDKLAAWGGESTLRSAKNYICPGFELVSFDPKTSISLIGREVFESDEIMAEVADKTAADITLVDQFACASSRFQFIEGTQEQVDKFCAVLQSRIGVERTFGSVDGVPLPHSFREDIDGLRCMPDYYGIWGDYSGKGLVIRSDEPVDFHPEYRIANVVMVDDLRDAVSQVNVATQTVTVYPPRRREELRDLLCSAGAQRVTDIGGAGWMEGGLAHDGFMPMARLVRWLNDEG